MLMMGLVASPGANDQQLNALKSPLLDPFHRFHQLVSNVLITSPLLQFGRKRVYNDHDDAGNDRDEDEICHLAL